MGQHDLPPMLPRLFCQFLVPAVLVSILPGRVNASFTYLSAPACGLAIQVDSDLGKYQVISKNPAWTFGGEFDQALKNMTNSSGHDEVGDYQKISFAWQAGQVPMAGSIRLYDTKPLILFAQTCGAAMELPPSAFPDFRVQPEGLHVFSYGHHTFAPPQFSTADTSTPWLLFDDRADALVISPASHFMVASMAGDGRTEIGSGLNPNLRNLPAGFTQQTILAFGRGINHVWNTWGCALRDLQGLSRPSNQADAVLKYLGYWTDNGAFYYYNYDPAQGYAGTLQALVKRYREEQIPIRYLQLDSWWYYKTTTDADGRPGRAKKADRLPAGEWNRYGGLLEYRAHPDLFPNGLDSFQKAIDLPLVTHNRWIDPASPYHEHYRISGVAAVDPAWWDNIASYLKASGIVTYEQDWLDRIYTYSPAFSSTVDTAEAFLDNMARACKEQDVTLQYCMPYPCYFLQGSRYQNLTTIRTSDDRFNSERWDHFLYTSRLADSMGIWPWADVFMSRETNNLLLATLSAGPVGIGDAIGAEDRDNLMRVVRADGVIVKPDAPIVPMDRSYLADAQGAAAPLMASTCTDHDGFKTIYLFAYNRKNTPANTVQFGADELGFNGSVYVYNYFSGTGRRLKLGRQFSLPLETNATAFLVVAPVGESEIAFLGDRDKFVGTGRQRISSLHDEAGKLTAGVVLAANEESVTLHGFAPAAPKVQVASGKAEAVEYNPETRYFTVRVTADPSSPLDKTAMDPVRQLTVTFEAQAR